MVSLLLRALEFIYYCKLVRSVDKLSALPREQVEPEALRLYRQIMALKVELDACRRQLAEQRGKTKPRVPLYVRAAQVFAYLLTRGDSEFQRKYLTDTVATIERWASVFKSGNPKRSGSRRGRKPTDKAIVELILLMKSENPLWGQDRIADELRKLGIKVSAPTVKKILEEHGFSTDPSGAQQPFNILHAAFKDALWAMDYFCLRTVKGQWIQVLLVIDIYTRELLLLKAHEGLDVDSVWTAVQFNHLLFESQRKPFGIVHDHGKHFDGQFERNLSIEDIERRRSAPGCPWTNRLHRIKGYGISMG
jgi:transposase